MCQESPKLRRASGAKLVLLSRVRKGRFPNMCPIELTAQVT